MKFASIDNCADLVCRGMVVGTHGSMKGCGLCTVVADVLEIDESAPACADGCLVDHIWKLQ